MKHKTTLLSVIAACALITACTGKDERIAFDDQYFKAKLSKVDKKRGQFAIEVSPASASLDGAREAGRYEATKYCIAQFGTSSVDWVAGPDVEDGALQVEGDKLQLRGACAP